MVWISFRDGSPTGCGCPSGPSDGSSLDSGIGDAGQHGHAGVGNGLVKDQNCWSPLKVDI